MLFRSNQKHYTTEIVANEMKLLGRRPEGAPQGGYAPQSAPAPQFQQPQQPQYQAAPVQEAAPVVPPMPANDPDDLPF